MLILTMGISGLTVLTPGEPLDEPSHEYIELTENSVSWEASVVNPQMTFFWPDMSSPEERYIVNDGTSSRLAVPGNVTVIGNEIRFDRCVAQNYRIHRSWEDGRQSRVDGTAKYGVSLWVMPKLLTRKIPVYNIGSEGLSPETNTRKYGFGAEVGIGMFDATTNRGRVGIAVGVDGIGRRSDTYIAIDPEATFGPITCGWQSGYRWSDGAPNGLYAGWTIGFHIK